jgi:protoporphyrin/coproporphyrin ferrochelatase
VRLAVVAFNLGGPDSLAAVEPFLKNLFSDPAVIDLPGFIRRPMAALVARRRAPVAKEIYARLGGRSPILEETQRQAAAVEKLLQQRGTDARVWVAMRCTEPSSDKVAQDIATWGAEHVVLLPLYPQFSTTTTRSSVEDWSRARTKAGLKARETLVCCYPTQQGFVDAIADLVQQTLTRRQSGVDYRLLFSAHGLPERTIKKGDPYRWQVERTVDALVQRLGITDLDWRLCFQSRVGPLRWIEPFTDTEIRKAGAEGKGVVVVPVAFVSEHSETLVELDMDYAELAQEAAVPDYLRVPTASAHPRFVEGLVDLVEAALAGKAGAICGGAGCPAGLLCGMRDRRR